jgi:hypothetical protein
MPVCEFPPYYLTGGVPKKLNGALSNVSEIRILFPIARDAF